MIVVEVPTDERNALLAQALSSFSAFGDLERAIEVGDFEQAYKVGRKISDGLTLIFDGGLGLVPQTDEPWTPQLPPEQLRAIATRMKKTADAWWESKRLERQETQREWAEITGLQSACTSILEQTDQLRSSGMR